MHDAIRALSHTRLVLRDDKYFTPAQLDVGRGSWVFEDGSGGFTLYPILLSLRSAMRPDNVREQLVYETELMLPDRTSINVCVTRWVEEVKDPSPMPVLQGLAPPPARRSHIAIEQIDYGNHRRGSLGLGEEELEIAASLIRTALRQMLDADVASLRTRTVAGRPVSATGELIERWRKPQPEFVELHRRLEASRQGSLVERINDPILARYSLVRADRQTYAMVEGEPEVRVTMPIVDKEEPRYLRAGVGIDGVSCPLDVYDLGRLTLDPPIDDLNGQPISSVRIYAVVDPFSPVIQPRSKPSASLAPETGTRAIQHMRNALLRVENDQLKRLDFAKQVRIDVVIL